MRVLVGGGQQTGQAGKGKLFAALLGALLLVCALVGLVGCGSNSQSSNSNDSSRSASSSGSGTLKVGVRSDIVGFSLLNEQTGKFYGLEVDIAKEMATRMGYANVAYIAVTPDSRKQMLQDGDVDCLVACYSIAESRLQNFDFSPAYYSDESKVVVETSSLFSAIDQLKGKKFGTMSGSNTAPQLVERLTEVGFTSGKAVLQTDDHDYTQFDNFELIQLDSYEELSVSLENGTLDAICMDGSIAKTYMDANRTFLDFVIAEQEYGVATQKDSALSAQVASTIQSMLDDGTIDTMIDVWD